MADTSVRELALVRLAESGLDEDDAKALHLEALAPTDTSRASSAALALPALKIVYHDPGGAPLGPHPARSPFFRLRYLTSAGEFGAKDSPRYLQPAGAGCCAYFPTNVDWSGIVSDPSRPVLLTEGELKAAKACREGFPTIGLGGVNSYRSAKAGIAFLPELVAVRWPERTVYVAFDSDYRTNPQVRAALLELARELTRRGALPFVVTLPELGRGSKTGLDDYLVAESGDSLQALLDVAEPLTLAEPLWKLNDRVLFVRDPGLVVDLETEQRISPGTFRDFTHATADYAERSFKADGTPTLKRVPAAKAWLTWPLRREVQRMTYRPGADRPICRHPRTNADEYNLWPGWGVVPKKGTTAPFTELVEHLVPDETTRRWLLRWFAYPIQRPGTKLFTAVVMLGVKHGTGKSLLGYTLGRIYGRNFTEISRADLHASFNDWAEGRQFVMGDDVTGSDRRSDADMLKKLITQQEMRVNAKYVPSYVVPDRVNYYFTSNQPDAFFLEDTDRRFFVHEVESDPLPQEFYAGYDAWLRGDGPAHLFHHLQRFSLGTFDPAAPALRTGSKDRMIADVKSDVAAFVERLRLDPDVTLRVGSTQVPGDLFSNRELLAIYDPQQTSRVTANGLGRELRRAGFRPVLGGSPVRTADGIDRYYAVRDQERWAKASRSAVVRHLGSRSPK